MPTAVKIAKLHTRPATSVSVAEAKAKLSSIIRGVEKKQVPITILRRGVPVAQVVPFPQPTRRILRGSMAGTARVLGDIVSPFLEEWTVSDWPEPNPLDESDSDED